MLFHERPKELKLFSLSKRYKGGDWDRVHKGLYYSLHEEQEFDNGEFCNFGEKWL